MLGSRIYLHTGPLGGEFNKIAGTRPPFSWEDNVNNWIAAVKSLHNDEIRKSLMAVLATAQVVSLQLLQEWWDREDPIVKRIQDWMLHPEGNMPGSAESEYGRKLSRLWLLEFGVFVQVEFKKPSLPAIALARQQAAEAAAAYRMAMLALSDWQNILLTGAAIQEDTNIHQAPQDRIPGCVQPCPWLGDRPATGPYPYYLWDNLLRRTVRSPNSDIDYAVISHTWGRWRAQPHRETFVEGVPWSVPCLERERLFDVTDLPHLLNSVPFSIRYVWLDLVCIPQDGRPLQNVEIGRQAGIFQSAKWAFIWFNKVSSWVGMKETLLWLSLYYLKKNEEREVPDYEASLAQTTTELAVFSEERVIPQGSLFFRSPDGTPQPYMELNGWFTSLWTLQEACLRPDFYLANKHWNLLSLRNGEAPVSLDCLVALFNKMWTKVPYDQVSLLPRGVYEIGAIFQRTNLHKLLEMSAVDIIIMGNQRWCADANRAKAIMSALGATGWYQKYCQQLSASVAVEDLLETFIDRRYPVQFAREVQSKFGALIYASADFTRLSSNFFQFDSRTGRIVDIALTGTMLPFDSDVRRQKFLPINDIAVEDHPAISTWTIHSDGSVKMRKAAIIVSWPGANEDRVIAVVHSIFGPSPCVKATFELHDWFRSFRPKSAKYAVCLLQRENMY
jgi:hypothetical protein